MHCGNSAVSDNSGDLEVSEKKNATGASGANGDKAGRSRAASGEERGRPVVRRTIIGAVVLAVLLPLAGFLFAYITVDVPEPEELTAAQVSSIYASDSETELARVVPPEGNRRQVPLEEVPEHVQNAVLAAEDREFWTNQGFSVTGFGRAVLGQLTGDDSAGGGSTITQQYVKNALVGNEHSYIRKARELVYAVKMANEWPKEDVLSAYLNTVYFGRNAYGIEAAAHAYFDKPASELTVEEGAVLAATIQLPSQLDPWANPEAAEGRWNYVLDGMVDMGVITPDQRAGMIYPETRDPSAYSAYTEATGTNGMIKNHVMAELEDIGISEEDVNTRGLRITTTIDTQAQNATVDAVHENMASLDPNYRAAAVSVEPGTGAVRAYYGGEDATGWDYGNAPLQTGSTFKIFGLAAALQQGIPLSTMYSSAPVTLPGNITITNVGGSGGGYSTIAEALKFSYNTSFIRLQNDLENTTQDTADMAHALGMARSLPGVPETLTENGEQPYEGIILGQYQSRPLDMAVALATLANGGVWHETYFVERVETGGGEVLYEHEGGPGERRVSETVADNVIYAMQPIAAYSNGALAGGRPSASKTGTTQLGDTGYNRDAWMIGTTPELASAVWVGDADSGPIFNEWGGNLYGANAPTQIWKDALDGALQGREVNYFDDPAPVTWGTGSAGSAYIPPPTTYAPAPPVQPTPVPESPVEEAPAEEPAAPAPEPAPEPEPAPQPNPLPIPLPDEGIELPELVLPEGLFPE